MAGNLLAKVAALHLAEPDDLYPTPRKARQPTPPESELICR